MTLTNDIKILVSAGSKHGATGEIANSIAETIAERGFDVTVAKPEEVTEIESYQAIVLGSAVYAGHWTDAAKDLAQRIAATDPKPAVWLFSSGPIGDPPKPEEDPVDVSEIIEVTSARENRVFAGKIDKSKLSFGEKAIMIAVRAPEGDFRNWEEITGWARAIADTLHNETRDFPEQ